MEHKNIHCDNIRCEDRKELEKIEKEHDNLKKKYSDALNKLDDFKKIIETSKMDDSKAKKIVKENLQLTNENNAKDNTIRNQRQDMYILKEQIRVLEDDIKEKERKDLDQVFLYRNLDAKKETLAKEVKKLEQKKKQVEIDFETIKRFREGERKELSKDRDERKLLLEKYNKKLKEFRDLEKQIKKAKKEFGIVEKKALQKASLKTKICLSKVNMAKKLLEKNKKDKAIGIMANVRKKYDKLNKEQQKILLPKIVEIEDKLI